MIQKLKFLTDHSGSMRYFKNTSWLFVEKILRVIVGLFVGIWVARYLGPEQFGLFSYAQSFVGLFTVIATLGLDGIVIRELVKDESRRDVLLGTAFRLKLVGALLLLIALAIAVKLSHQDTLTTLLVFVIASATVLQSFNVIDFYFQSKVLSKYIVYANIVSLLVSILIKVALILTQAPLLSFAYSVLFDSLVLACGFLYVYRYNKLFVRKWQFDAQVALSLLKDSWMMMLAGAAILIYMKIDIIIIKEMIDSEAVGQYAAAVKISEAWYFIPMVIVSSLFPAIIKAKKISEELYYARLQQLYNFMVLMAIVIAIPMTFLSNMLIEFLYGEQFNKSGIVLMIHIWAGVFVFLSVVNDKWFYIENKASILTFKVLTGAVSNILLNIILIPIYGIEGAAIATIISYSISVLWSDLLFRSLKKIFIMKIRSITLSGYLKLLMRLK